MKDDKPAKSGPPMQLQKTSHKAEKRLGRDIQSKIGQQLRAMYDDVVQQGVPDRFTEMLRQLEKPNGTDGEGLR